PEPAPPVTADGQPASPAPTVPPAPVQAPAPAVGEGSKAACAPLNGKGSKPGSSLSDVIAEEAKCTGVSADVIKALIAAKGGNKRNPLVVTREAADWVGVGGGLNDPRTSVRAGALLLAKLYKFYDGDLNRALAAYEVGITAVTRSGGIPNNKSVKTLLAEFQRAYRKDGDKPVQPETPPEHPNLRRVEEEVKNVLTGPQLAPRVSFSSTAPWRKMILEASRIYGVDPALIEAVMLSESGGNPKDHSTAGAKGLMQLMPETARYMGVKNIWDPRQNINGGTRYLKEMLDRFNGNAVLAVAAYNAGPNRESLRGRKVPTIVETVYYTTRVMHRYAQLTGTAATDFSDRLTAKGKRLYDRESARLEKLWGPTPEEAAVPLPTPAPTAR
ncbi:MAG: lytic transglycosylase, partial [Elusimicrobia bacterium]